VTVRNPIASQRQALVRVSGVTGYWSTKTGGETSADTSTAWDGGSLTPEVLSSPATTANIVVSRPYRPAIHQSIRKSLAGKVGRWRTTVSVQDVDADLHPIGRPVTYADALLVRVTAPEHDAGSGDTSMWELEFAVSREA
jgi:hypothetical protein